MHNVELARAALSAVNFIQLSLIFLNFVIAKVVISTTNTFKCPFVAKDQLALLVSHRGEKHTYPGMSRSS